MISFAERLAFSRGVREGSDLETIKAMISGCVSVVKTDEGQDRAGVDYIAILRRGARILIDAKSRDKGAAKWWKNGPELALESWSVMPGGKFQTPENKKKTGWTLCEKKETDFIFFSFDPSECKNIFLVSFQLLRMAFVANFGLWFRKFKRKIQESESWESQCVYVPAEVVFTAISCAQTGHRS